jgi:hypothetical protein
MSAMQIFFAVNVIGGITVLASYWIGLSYYIEKPEYLWGGVDGSLRTFFTISMLPAAIGYITFFYFMSCKSGVIAFTQSSLLGPYTPSIICALFLTASTIWMPATISYINSHQLVWWITAVISLWATGLALIALLIQVYSIPVYSTAWVRNLTLIGLIYITFHCVVLDAIIWVSRFPKLH